MMTNDQINIYKKAFKIFDDVKKYISIQRNDSQWWHNLLKPHRKPLKVEMKAKDDKCMYSIFFSSSVQIPFSLESVHELRQPTFEPLLKKLAHEIWIAA